MNFELELNSLVVRVREGNFEGLTLIDSGADYSMYSKDTYRYPFSIKVSKKTLLNTEVGAFKALSNSGITPNYYYSNEKSILLERIHGIELDYTKFNSEDSLRYFLRMLSKIEDAGISIKDVSRKDLIYDEINDRIVLTKLDNVVFGNTYLNYLNRKRMDIKMYDSLSDSYSGDNFFNIVKECGYRGS